MIARHGALLKAALRNERRAAVSRARRACSQARALHECDDGDGTRLSAGDDPKGDEERQGRAEGYDNGLQLGRVVQPCVDEEGFRLAGAAGTTCIVIGVVEQRVRGRGKTHGIEKLHVASWRSVDMQDRGR